MQNSIIAPSSIPAVKYVEARHYTRALTRNGVTYPRLRERTQGAVIHCTDGAEGLHKAEDVAEMFRVGWDDAKHWRSAHKVRDTDSAVQCVPYNRRAYHCGHNGNDAFLGLELTGRASQTHEQWLDSVSLPMLCAGAYDVAEWCRDFHIPAVYIDYTAVKREARGITTHYDIKRAWGQTTHTDPGPGFPLADFVEAVRICLATM